VVRCRHPPTGKRSLSVPLIRDPSTPLHLPWRHSHLRTRPLGSASVGVGTLSADRSGPWAASTARPGASGELYP
jgi:hypothetical protein